MCTQAHCSDAVNLRDVGSNLGNGEVGGSRIASNRIFRCVAPPPPTSATTGAHDGPVESANDSADVRSHYCCACRSSQFYASSLTQSKQIHAVSTVLDLRRECTPCRSRSRALLELVRPHWWPARVQTAAYDAVGNPRMTSCPNCECNLKAQSGKVSTTKVCRLPVPSSGPSCCP